MILLDTCAVIDLLSGKGNYKQLQEIIATQSVAISSISINELLIDARQAKKQIIYEFMKSVEIIPFDEQAAIESVKIEEELTKKGSKIGKLDIFIAGICRVHKLMLITSDNDFKKIPQLDMVLI
ncbi:type II toxin-antitoxin system VapC family toxin [Candidatus Woesearchaeota archaeon]|nr:type II toxin-antitoxin system VapC family toxin [Candidatus Woesearchaeota archaeon]